MCMKSHSKKAGFVGIALFVGHLIIHEIPLIYIVLKGML